jgi:hypothetical protein
VPPDLMAFHRQDQMQRLKALLRRGLRLGRRPSDPEVA